jgi:hypothetical protein
MAISFVDFFPRPFFAAGKTDHPGKDLGECARTHLRHPATQRSRGLCAHRRNRGVEGCKCPRAPQGRADSAVRRVVVISSHESHGERGRGTMRKSYIFAQRKHAENPSPWSSQCRVFLVMLTSTTNDDLAEPDDLLEAHVRVTVHQKS